MKFLIKYIRTVTALCLVFMLMCPVFLPAGGTEMTPFEDVKESDWHYSYVKLLTDEGILKGMTPTTFEPGGKLTAAQLCTLVSRYLGLEEKAGLARRHLIALGAEGADMWFSGYAAVLYEKGILDKSDFSLKEKDGVLQLDGAAANALNSPVRRDLTAKIITKSFETDRRFILGGGYDNASLEKHAAHISDYEKIPQNMREYVVKSYYNGIFNGYDDGSFEPGGHLTRAEAAKVISVIMNYPMRELYEYRDLPPTAVVTAEDYDTDWSDTRKLSGTRLTDVLWQVYTGLEFTRTHINLRQENIIPAGYTLEARFYTLENGVYNTFYTTASADSLLPKTHSEYAEGERSVLIYLKNADAGNRIDAVAEFRADKNGKIYFSKYECR